MDDWNVVVSVLPGCYRQARLLLQPFGRVRITAYYNVLTVKVDDIRWFLDTLREKMMASPAQYRCLHRIMPVQKTLVFQSPQEFEALTSVAVGEWESELAGKAFYVRMHRRGFKDRLSSQEQERILDSVLLAALEKAGNPGRISFEDPDAVCVVETIGQWAGLSLWTREDGRRYPFLHLD